MKRLIATLCLLVTAAGIASGQTQVEPDMALQMLNAQQQQFEKGVVKVADNVYTAIGFHGANTTMIVGTDGVIIVDTLFGPTSAAQAADAFRQYSDKPVKAIIYTHSHGDHIGGASAFVGEEKPDIYGTETFGSAEGVNNAVDPVKAKRNVRQFGRNLSSSEMTNRGVAPAGTEDSDRGKGFLPPTVTVPSSGLKTTIAGVDIEFHIGPGETDDAMFIWLPKAKVLLAGDNFYSSFPNLYAIRGTAYRDVLNWSESVGKMAALEPHVVIPGHTMPIQGQEAATTALQDYSEAIRSVYDQTVRGINAGKGPDQLAHEVKLPKHLREKPYLIEFYGTVPHAVRAIYSGLLGWYDGNPTTLSPMEPRLKARKIAELAGGTQKLTERMNAALAEQDYQWALELSDHVKWLDDGDKELARKVKIEALRGLAAREYNAPNRNYYLSYANELESGALSDLWF
ncbi:alkyl/aryl-sulfatase [Allorhodopirellula heiligendammensis]|uniref:Metallo-beta-lactamase superfamily protein n=1 Tax=Allorhodopirellula heiligendammensis TaxID=2714739 RepID=A0A5C6BA81_9BACT|nr:alkyl/aryl-sulfatase [Allorhodopirellula heiligendammensis]TWU07414.1 Metallo-beta-lactamase superfamily protein [Allorhodopirellula heiligendammensis]